MTESFRFFNPYGGIHQSSHRLPHWEQAGACYFVTFRLADSLPLKRLRQWREERSIWLGKHPQPWAIHEEVEYHRRFSAALDRWLDAGSGACVLRQPHLRGQLVELLQDGDGEAFNLHSFVVMPNHVHVLVSLADVGLLGKQVKRWKGGSARRINADLGRTGRLWSDAYFDRLIRDRRHYLRCLRYIRSNPVRARLRENSFTLREVQQGGRVSTRHSEVGE